MSAPLRLSVTGHIDGFAVRDEDTGVVLAVRGGLLAAAAAREEVRATAHNALAQLAACLATASSRKDA